MSKVPHHPELEVLQAPKIDKEKDVKFWRKTELMFLMHKTITIQIAIENAWKDLGLDHKQLPEKETVSEAE